jgi:hypothetical protein
MDPPFSDEKFSDKIFHSETTDINLTAENNLWFKGTLMPLKAMFIKLALWPGWPDWANFRLLGDCLLWVVLNITDLAQMFVLLFSTENVLILTKKDWATFWEIFLQTHLVTPGFDLNQVFSRKLRMKRIHKIGPSSNASEVSSGKIPSSRNGTRLD